MILDVTRIQNFYRSKIFGKSVFQNTFDGTGIYLLGQRITSNKIPSNKSNSKRDENINLLLQKLWCVINRKILANLQNDFHETGIQKMTRSKIPSNKSDSRRDENIKLLVAAKAVERDLYKILENLRRDFACY